MRHARRQREERLTHSPVNKYRGLTRELHDEARQRSVGIGAQREGAAMLFKYIGHEHQSESASAGLGGEERCEQMARRLRADTATVVDNLNLYGRPSPVHQDGRRCFRQHSSPH